MSSTSITDALDPIEELVPYLILVPVAATDD